ncbi:hypothetical protein LTR08_004348 [Meristemomyces frigidus]|nr:hypothetical protein LTR08_004348 [Meristemomyces frigidus]
MKNPGRRGGGVTAVHRSKKSGRIANAGASAPSPIAPQHSLNPGTPSSGHIERREAEKGRLDTEISRLNTSRQRGHSQQNSGPDVQTLKQQLVTVEGELRRTREELEKKDRECQTAQEDAVRELEALMMDGVVAAFDAPRVDTTKSQQTLPQFDLRTMGSNMLRQQMRSPYGMRNHNQPLSSSFSSPSRDCNSDFNFGFTSGNGPRQPDNLQQPYLPEQPNYFSHSNDGMQQTPIDSGNDFTPDFNSNLNTNFNSNFHSGVDPEQQPSLSQWFPPQPPNNNSTQQIPQQSDNGSPSATRRSRPSNSNSRGYWSRYFNGPGPYA